MSGRKLQQPTIYAGIVTMPGVSAASAVMAYEDFVAISGLQKDMFGDDAAPAEVRFSPRLLGLTLEPILSATGLQITPQRTFESTERCDLVFCPAILQSACVGADGGRPRFDQTVLAWIRRQYEAGALIVSLCTGSYLLAEAGLLDGCPATCHWGSASHFKASYPKVDVLPERSLVVTGDGGRLVVAGTGIYHQNLIIYILQRLAGHSAAHTYAKISGKFWVEGDQDVFARMNAEFSTDDKIVRDAQCWLSENLAADAPVTTMAERAFLTERTFTRRFKAATGWTPRDYVQAVRLEQAKSLLEASTLPVEEIASKVGFGEPSSFRRMFKGKTGLAPLDYRRRFKLPPIDIALSDSARNCPVSPS